jgi:hypothetical protein
VPVDVHDLLDGTVVNVALPSIQKDLHTSVDQLEWVVNGYRLSFAARGAPALREPRVRASACRAVAV